MPINSLDFSLLLHLSQSESSFAIKTYMIKEKDRGWGGWKINLLVCRELKAFRLRRRILFAIEMKELKSIPANLSTDEVLSIFMLMFSAGIFLLGSCPLGLYENNVNLFSNLINSPKT